MSKNEKIALLGYILFMVAFVVSDSSAGKITWLFFSGVAAYQFISPTKRAPDAGDSAASVSISPAENESASEGNA